MTESEDNSIHLVGLSQRHAVIVVIGCALLFAVIFAAGQVTGLAYIDRDILQAGASAALATGFLALIWFDVREYRLPDVITMSLGVAGLIISWLVGSPDSLQQVTVHAVSALAAYFGIWLLAVLSERFFGRQGIGLGDGKLLAAIVCWMGPLALPPVLLVSSGLGILLSVLLQSTTKSAGSGSRRYIPFGPALCVAAWIVWNLSGIWPFMPQY